MASSPVENRILGVFGKYWLFDKALQKQDAPRGPLAGLLARTEGNRENPEMWTLEVSEKLTDSRLQMVENKI